MTAFACRFNAATAQAQARPAPARCAAARRGRALAAAGRAGGLFARHPGPAAIRARRRPDRGHRCGGGRALHGAGQRRGQRGRSDAADGAGENPARATNRAAKPPALCAPGRERGRQPDALPRRRLRAWRPPVSQSGAAVGGGHSGDHGAAWLGHGGGGAPARGLGGGVSGGGARARVFLAAPPLLAAATGERATEEELGGADMHTTLSGLGEYLAQDDRHAIGLARELLAATGWGRQRQAPGHGAEPLLPADDLLALMPEDLRQPVDMREVIARLVDGSELLEFKARHGAATVCAQARIAGHPVGLVSNNGPIDVAGANKATHFIQWMCQLGQPLIYLQNTTGYMVGKDSEQGGMIKHGSKMLQAVTQATVPQLTYSAAPT